MGGKRVQDDGVEVREYPSGRKAFRIHFTYRGVECRETLKGVEVNPKNKRFADNLRATILHEIGIGTFDYTARFPNSKRGRQLAGGSSTATVSEVRQEWEDDVKARGLEYSTVQSYTSAMNAWIAPTFGHLPLRELNAKLVGRERDALLRRLAAKSVANYLGAMRDFLDYCVSHDYVQENAAAGIGVGRKKRSGTKKKVAGDIQPLSAEEVQATLAACDDPLFHRYLTFAFFTGMRPSELYMLEWKNVDWSRGTVTVRKVRVKGKVKPYPKTNAGLRDVLLLPAALEALKAQRAETELAGHGLIWVNPKTREPLTDYRHTRWPWEAALRKAKIKHRTQYQTRHSYASNLLSDGENPWFVARQMGHKDVQMVMRIYGHWIEKAGRIDGHRWVSDFGADPVEAPREAGSRRAK